VLLSIDRHLVQTIVPGTRLTVIGIYSVFQASGTAKYVGPKVCFCYLKWSTLLIASIYSFCSHKGAVGVKQPYIRIVGLEQSRDDNSNGPSSFTLDEVV
jgi:DNA replication licensing factor MCM5